MTNLKTSNESGVSEDAAVMPKQLFDGRRTCIVVKHCSNGAD